MKLTNFENTKDNLETKFSNRQAGTQPAWPQEN